MSREKVLTVKLSDCETQTFRAGGKGGQKQNKTSTGVRIIHHPSGARGESREERSQLQNKRIAFKRMGESIKFQIWAKTTTLKLPSINSIVDEDMHPDNLIVEYGPFG